MSDQGVVNMENAVILYIAKVCHAVNKAYCESLGDNSQVKWDDAPIWQQESAVAGVKFIMDNPSSTPMDSHKSWLKQKSEEGWTYGKVKDEVAKTHPCYVPYADLPQAQKSKDYIFGAIVRSIAGI